MGAFSVPNMISRNRRRAVRRANSIRQGQIGEERDVISKCNLYLWLEVAS